MFDTQKTLDVSQEQMDVIEAALHTQSKILHVQADAGGEGAHDKLNAVKSLLTVIEQRKQQRAEKTTAQGMGWFGFTRSLP